MKRKQPRKRRVRKSTMARQTIFSVNLALLPEPDERTLEQLADNGFVKVSNKVPAVFADRVLLLDFITQFARIEACVENTSVPYEMSGGFMYISLLAQYPQNLERFAVLLHENDAHARIMHSLMESEAAQDKYIERRALLGVFNRSHVDATAAPSGRWDGPHWVDMPIFSESAFITFASTFIRSVRNWVMNGLGIESPDSSVLELCGSDAWKDIFKHDLSSNLKGEAHA